MPQVGGAVAGPARWARNTPRLPRRAQSRNPCLHAGSKPDAQQARNEEDSTAHTLGEIAGIISEMCKNSLGDMVLHPGHATVRARRSRRARAAALHGSLMPQGQHTAHPTDSLTAPGPHCLALDACR
jgi:hypothetical protein